MDIGVFIPIGNNGWLISETSPQYMPTFELNKQIVQTAEHYGFDFALSMIKLHGFGGSLLGVCVNMQQLLKHLTMYRAWEQMTT